MNKNTAIGICKAIMGLVVSLILLVTIPPLFVLGVGLAAIAFMLIMVIAICIVLPGPFLMLAGVLKGGLAGALIFVFGLGLFIICLRMGDHDPMYMDG